MDQIPTTLCGQSIVKQLGRGIQGTVYQTNDNYALKRIFNIKSPDTIAELDILRRVNNKYVINSEMVSLINGDICMIMKMGSITLHDYLSNNDLTDNEKFNISLSLMQGLDYLHSNNIAHLDLHMNNILLFEEDGYYVPKIIDYGMARNYKHSVISHRHPSPLICPPELLFRLIQRPMLYYLGPEVDNWGLGCLITYIYQGALPFESESKLPHRLTPELALLYQIAKVIVFTNEQSQLYENLTVTLPGATYLASANYVPFSEEFKSTPGYIMASSLLVADPNNRKDLKSIIRKFLPDYEVDTIVYTPPELTIKEDKPGYIYNTETREKIIYWLKTNYKTLSNDIIEEAVKLMDVVFNKLDIPKDRYQLYIIEIVYIANAIMQEFIDIKVLSSIRQFIKDDNVFIEGLKEIMGVLDFKLYIPL